MASAGIINATIVHITVGRVKINHQLSAELNITMEPRETLNKDSNSWRGRARGAMSFELSGEAEMAPDAALGFEQLFNAFAANQSVNIAFTTAVTGDKEYKGTAVITNLTQSAGVEENVNISYSFAGNGAIAKATIVAGGAVEFLGNPEDDDVLVFDEGGLNETTFRFLDIPAGTSGDVEVEIEATLADTLENFLTAFNTEIATYTASLPDITSSTIKIESDNEGVEYVVDITTTSSKLNISEMKA